MTKINKWQKITIFALIGMGLFNPMTVEVLDQYFKWAYTGISGVCAIWVIGFLLYKALKPEKVNIPKKSAKTEKAGKLIPTN